MVALVPAGQELAFARLEDLVNEARTSAPH